MKPRIIAGALSLASLIAASPVQPAEFKVSTSAELRAVLIKATGNGEDDQIILAKGTYAPGPTLGPFTYNSTLGNNLTISAEADSLEGDVVLDGEDVSNILVLKQATYKADQRFSLNGLTLKNGRLDSDVGRRAGAVAIYNAAATIDNSVLKNNYSNLSQSGSAIYFDGGDKDSEFALSNVRILDNTASSGSSYEAVSVFVQGGTVSISDSEFSRNKNTSRGTLYLKSGISATITDSIFAENEAHKGGAIYASGATVKLDLVKFKNNKATNAAGAVFGARIEGSGLEFSGNTSETSGAIFAASLTLDKSRITENQGREVIWAGSEGDISNTLFLDNVAGTHKQSGIVYCQRECNIVNNVFAGNTGAPGVVMGDYSDPKLVANSVFLTTNASAIGFVSTSGKASVFNNFLADNLKTLPPAQVDQRGNFLTSSNAGLNTDYAPVSGSVLIDSGISDTNLVTLPTTDALGNRRIAGDGVDIGMIEFESSSTAPLIASITLQNSVPKNLDALVFSVTYELSEGRDLGRAELWIDENDVWETVDISDGAFSTAFFEAGNHTIKLRLTDSAAETTIAEYGFTLEALTTEQFVDRIREDEAKLCAEKPSDCGINTQDYVATGIKEGKKICLEDLVDCGADTSKWFKDGKKAGVIQGREAVITQCKNSPADCEIDTGVFDQTLIPTMESGDWELFGTGQAITDLETTFVDARVVWIRSQSEWQAFSPHDEVKARLAEKGISSFTEIPADRGFWVKQ